MAYKRYFYRNGKKFGPYYYESYRDENGDVKKKYIGKVNPDKKKISVGKLVLGGLVLLAVIAVVSVSVQVSNEGMLPFDFESVRNVFGSVKEFASNSISTIVGFVVEDGEEEVAPQEEAPAEEEAEEEPEVEEEVIEEEVIEEEEGSVGGILGGVEEIVEEPIEEVEEVLESLDENVSEIVGENVTEVVEENVSVEENVTEVVEVENVTEVVEVENVTVEGNVSVENVTEVVEVENVSVEENVTEVVEVENVSVEENVTEVVEVENVTVVNISVGDVSVKQYKAVVNRRVKWIKKLVVSDGDGDYGLEIPLGAENISVMSGDEVAEAEAEINEYDDLVEEVDREDIVDGGITGFVARDIRSGQGILTRLWVWVKGFTISGNVIDEIDLELSGDIVETNESKIVNVTGVVEAELAKGPEAEVAVEYYTDAPLSEESVIDRGKRVVVSADDVLNYSNILAYAVLDNRVRMNSSRLKVYHLVPVEEEVVLDEKVKKEKEEKAKKEKKNVTEIVEEEENGSQIDTDVDEGVENVSVVVENVSVDVEGGEENGTQITQIDTDVKKEKVKEDKNKTKKGEENLTLVGITGEAVLDGRGEVVGGRSEGNVSESVSVEVVWVEVNYSSYDLDGDGYVDYVEWIVPHLSNQTYEIIYISGAEHLDSNRTFVEDIYDDVSELDGNWSYVPSGDYVRVSFERELDSSKDITIYAREKCNESILINGTEVPCEIYEKKKRLDELRRLVDG